MGQKINVIELRAQVQRQETPALAAVAVLLDIVEALLNYYQERANYAACLLLSGQVAFPGPAGQQCLMELRLHDVLGQLDVQVAMPQCARADLLARAGQEGLEPAAFLDAVGGCGIAQWGPPLTDREGFAWEYRSGRFWASRPETATGATA